MNSARQESGSISAASPDAAARSLTPVKILILALGGEGGAVMADWLVDALLAADYPVQATSVPGVAQRTGATSYYIEFLPIQGAHLQGAEPVFCLSPAPGQIDLLVSSELLETGRAIERGLVSPSLTTLISSTSRFLTVHEKMQMADGRLDGELVLQAARAMSRDCVLFDMAQVTSVAGTIISSVMFGALAASGRLPLSRAQCEQIVSAGGRATEASLRGFAAGFEECARQLANAQPVTAATNRAAMAATTTRAKPAATSATHQALVNAPAAHETIHGVSLPARVAEIAALGFTRLADFQDQAYAAGYLDYVARFAAAEGASSGYSASRAAARFLALWMAYEDVIRVADLKSRAARFARIRDEFGAKADEPVVVRDFLKPGVEEVAAILPARFAEPLLRWAARRKLKTFSDGLRLQTSSVSGLMMMRTLAALRTWRRKSSRFAQEQALIVRWARALIAAMAVDQRLALEIAECPRLIKGYSDTFARGKRSFVEILERLVEPALTVTAPGKQDWAALADSVKRAREAALEDPAGRALAVSLGLPVPEPKIQPLRFMPMKRPR